MIRNREMEEKIEETLVAYALQNREALGKEGYLDVMNQVYYMKELKDAKQVSTFYIGQSVFVPGEPIPKVYQISSIQRNDGVIFFIGKNLRNGSEIKFVKTDLNEKVFLTRAEAMRAAKKE